MKKIHYKIIGLVILCLLLLGLTMSFVSILKIRSLGNENLKTLEQELRDHFDLMARSQVEIALSLAEKSYSRRDELGEDAARKEAEIYIRELRYAEDGYFFIYDSKGNTVVLLGNEAEGTNRLDLKDADGKHLIREIIASAKTGDGFTDFQYNRPGETEASPKRSYTAYFAPWDWIIGTGNYVDDIDAMIEEQREHINTAVKRIILILILGVTSTASGQ